MSRIGQYFESNWQYPSYFTDTTSPEMWICKIHRWDRGYLYQ